MRAGHCSKRVATTRLHAARQRDGVRRDETAWTWWTPPLRAAGCLARRYPATHRPLRVRAEQARTRVAATGQARSAGWLLVACGYPEREVQALARVQRAHRGTPVMPMRAFVLVVGCPGTRRPHGPWSLRSGTLSKGILSGGVPAGGRFRSFIWMAGHTGISPCRGNTALRVAMIARSTGSPGS